MAVTYCPREEMGEGVHNRHQLVEVEDGRQGDPVDPWPHLPVSHMYSTATCRLFLG